MEASAKGWKLHALAEHADKLTGKNATLLVDRALSDAGDWLDKTTLFNKLEKNQFTQSADTIKLGRSDER